jgi:YVTN family beta-propeller protein
VIDRRFFVLGGATVLTAGLVVVAAGADRSAVVAPPPDSVPSVAEMTGEAAQIPAEPVVATSVSPMSDPTGPGATGPGATGPGATGPDPTVPLAPADGKSSDERRLVDAFTVVDEDLQPKSIVASGNGLFFAQNMMYRHNVAVFDRSGTEVGVISDEVDLAAFGVEGGGVVQGSPVEAAFTPDGRYVYVSNYKMFGPGWNPVADDGCDRGDWDDSFVYKIDVDTLEIVAVIRTGAVPKFLAVSPDGSRLVVSNWCGFDVSVIDTANDVELARIDVGRHPRGIAVRSDSSRAYVTVMGEARIDVIDLSSLDVVDSIRDAAGSTPRHVLLSADDRFLFVSNHTMNSVRKIDLASGEVVGVASTGTETRTMALADDGASLYVVNYRDGTVSKVATSDMEVLQTVPSGVRPVGIAYDPATRQVWVANYAGTLRVFRDE